MLVNIWPNHESQFSKIAVRTDRLIVVHIIIDETNIFYISSSTKEDHSLKTNDYISFHEVIFSHDVLNKSGETELTDR